MNNFTLKKSFYTHADTLGIARALLGKKLMTSFEGKVTAGIICETEAYCGVEDRGCHAYNGRFTERTKIMYAEGGVSYVYLCYGVHYLFNVVTHVAGQPHAVLIRAIEPTEGIPTMLERRNLTQIYSGYGRRPRIGYTMFGFNNKTQRTFVIGSGHPDL
ncbi:MAG: DNA-3-methyladenine glycosylase [Chitinophagaceae bacterium]